MGSDMLTEKLSAAILFAESAHAGQFYGDLPYISHLLDVLDRTSKIIDDVDTKVAAVLHDVVEDTRCSLGQVRENFGDKVADIVALVTKDETLSYEENIRRIVSSGNVGAIIVKYCDNRANGNGDKSHMSDKRRIKLETRYENARAVLETALDEHGVTY